MSPAGRACNWEQGEWVRRVGVSPLRFDLIAAVTVKPGNTWQARNRHRGRKALVRQMAAQQNRGYDPVDFPALATGSGPGSAGGLRPTWRNWQTRQT